MRKRNILNPALIIALITLFPSKVFADSSWIWISEKRPFDILPWVAIGTILIEWLSIWLIPKTGHCLRVLGIVMIANALDVSADDLLTDNLKHSSSPVSTEIHDLLLDCNQDEKAILTKTVRFLKATLSEFGI